MAALQRLVPFQRLLPHQRLAGAAAYAGFAPVVTATNSAWGSAPCRSFSASDDSKSATDFSNLNNVIQALREISKEQGLVSAADTTKNQQLQLPDTKLLKELGHHELVHAIRKKHGGFVHVAALMGVSKGDDAFEIHKQKSSRANRRQKRTARLAKHHFY